MGPKRSRLATGRTLERERTGPRLGPGASRRPGVVEGVEHDGGVDAVVSCGLEEPFALTGVQRPVAERDVDRLDQELLGRGLAVESGRCPREVLVLQDRLDGGVDVAGIEAV